MQLRSVIIVHKQPNLKIPVNAYVQLYAPLLACSIQAYYRDQLKRTTKVLHL